MNQYIFLNKKEARLGIVCRFLSGRNTELAKKVYILLGGIKEDFDKNNASALIKNLFEKNNHSTELLSKAFGLALKIETNNLPPEGKKRIGIWITLKKEFECTQCGDCCHLPGAYASSAYLEDLERWNEEKRKDILEWIDLGREEFWFDPKTGKTACECPWLLQNKNTKLFECSIHETKPYHCRKYPVTPKHALESGCEGYSMFL